MVKLGLKEQGRTDDSSLSQVLNIESFRTHPQFRFSKKYYDIALIELEREVELNDAICTACLWLEDITPEEAMRAIGFVSPGFSPNFDPILRNVTLKEISGKECGEILPLSGRTLPDGLVKEQFCAGSDDQDTCEVRKNVGKCYIWSNVEDCRVILEVHFRWNVLKSTVILFH